MTAIAVEVDCHSYPWHEPSEERPMCGPAWMVSKMNEYGVLIEFMPESTLADWAWWYRVMGPRDNVRRFLIAEYCDASVIDDYMQEEST